MWQRWDALRPDGTGIGDSLGGRKKGADDPMVSPNHDAAGAAGEGPVSASCIVISPDGREETCESGTRYFTVALPLAP